MGRQELKMSVNKIVGFYRKEVCQTKSGTFI